MSASYKTLGQLHAVYSIITCNRQFIIGVAVGVRAASQEVKGDCVCILAPIPARPSSCMMQEVPRIINK